MSIASELTNLEGNIEDSYDAVNDMGGIIPAQRNMDNLDQAIRTIPQNSGITATTFHWGGSPNYSMYKDSGYTTAATYSDIATAYAGGLVYIADGEDEVTYVVVSDIPDAHTITVTGIGLPGYEGASASYTYASSTWAKTATEFQTKLTAGTNVQINGTTISATDTTYSAMGGATSSAAGTSGLVPAPAAGDQNDVLKGDGTWGLITTSNLSGFSTANTTDTWVPVSSNGNLQHRVIKAFNSDGTIPTSAIANGAVTPAKQATGNSFVSYYSPGGTTVTTTGNKDIITKTWTVPYATTMIFQGFGVISTSANTSNICIYLDGNAIGQHSTTNVTGYFVGTSVFARADLSAGSHTVKLVLRAQNSSTTAKLLNYTTAYLTGWDVK